MERHGVGEGDVKARGGRGGGAGYLVVSVSGTGKEVSWKRGGGEPLAEDWECRVKQHPGTSYRQPAT